MSTPLSLHTISTLEKAASVNPGFGTLKGDPMKDDTASQLSESSHGSIHDRYVYLQLCFQQIYGHYEQALCTSYVLGYAGGGHG